MEKVKFKDLGIPRESFEEELPYLHLEYVDSGVWAVWLTSEEFTEHFHQAEIANWYEVGIVEKEDTYLEDLLGKHSVYHRFYEVSYE